MRKPPASPDLRILETQIFRGPNYWSYEPCIRLLVDLTSVNRAVGMFTADIDVSSSAGSTTQRALEIAGVPHRAV